MSTHNIPRRSQPTPQNPIVITSDDEAEASDDSMEIDFASAHSRQQQIGFLEGYNHNHAHRPQHQQPQPRQAPLYTSTLEQEKKVRSRLREERHAALCVLMDRELLTIQALAAQEVTPLRPSTPFYLQRGTLPQARRRFLAKLMAPDDPEMAASIRADRFTIQHPSTTTAASSASASASSTSTTVQRKIVDVHESDDTGWRRPTDPSSVSAAAVAGVASPGGSSAMTTTPVSRGYARRMASMTPERTRHSPAGRPRASASRSQQTRERERRRRWSGAEREDAGIPFGGFSP
ncbi:predicted protein [Aspergillus terreus NIH2624]|uniref:Uncharacterized protein n=1 Tax=Aspergillus terreus (strain NIH 2624 / FGSC A1156) TaxID=341663 RepID=Q0CYV5_ASPTN|nr:uncharacterized protein ATEG_01129 [Aspergillus terreus NIH2624]EAU37886.1 predicted protein [Aspergillus terreus NIH2624]